MARNCTRSWLTATETCEYALYASTASAQHDDSPWLPSRSHILRISQVALFPLHRVSLTLFPPQNVIVICLCLSTAFVVVRAGARWAKIRRVPIAAEDISSYVALASFAIMCSLYLAAMPVYYNTIAVQNGSQAPYPSLEADLTVMLKEFLAVQFFFWLTLWGAKCSLLFMSKVLTAGLPIQTRIWWAVMIFTLLAYVGCAITQFLSCSSIHNWFTPCKNHHYDFC